MDKFNEEEYLRTLEHVLWSMNHRLNELTREWNMWKDLDTLNKIHQCKQDIKLIEFHIAMADRVKSFIDAECDESLTADV